MLETIKKQIGIGEENKLTLSKKSKQKIHIWWEDSDEFLLNIKQRTEYCLDSTQVDKFLINDIINNGYEIK